MLPLYSHFSRLLLGALEAGTASQLLHLAEVEQRLDAAAQVHDGEHRDADVAAERHEGVVSHEGHRCHGGQVVAHDDAHHDQHHLEGSLLHRVHGLLARHGLAQHPDDGQVAEDHEGKGEEDEPAEDLGGAPHAQEGLGERVGQDEPPHQRRHGRPDAVVTDAREEDGVHHGNIAVQADAGEEEWCRVLDSVVEELEVPDLLVVQDQAVDKVDGRHEAEEGVQDGQVEDEDV